MCIHPGAEAFHLFEQGRQRRGVALCQLLGAPGQRLGDAVQLGLHRSGEGREPLVVDHEHLDIGLSQGSVAGRDPGVERLLRLVELAAGLGLAVDQGQGCWSMASSSAASGSAQTSRTRA